MACKLYRCLQCKPPDTLQIKLTVVLLVVNNVGISDITRIQSLVRVRGAKMEVSGRRERKQAALLKQQKEQEEAALKLQSLSRVRAAKVEACERRKRKEAAVSVGGSLF